MFANDNVAKAQNMFGHFDIQETIGQGGMGVVYLALDTTLGRVVALKVLRDDLRSMPKVVTRFQREAEAIASLDHPHIAQVYSVGSIGKIPYFAMEFIDGSSLSRILRRRRSLHWRDALKITRHITEALAAAHEAQIIHRDIKPGNIIIGKNGNAYVTDFGIAKILTADTQLTIDGSKLGTPQYMSPERCQNQPVTAAGDIYSLGVVLFQMIAGRLPYEASDPIDLTRKIIMEPPARLSDYVDDVPEDVERLIAFMLEKRPEDRPADAATLSELVGRVSEGKPLVDTDSGMEGALDQLRAQFATPVSGIDSSIGSGTKGAAGRYLVDPLRSAWQSVPASARVAGIACALLLCSALAGMAVSAWMRADSATALLQHHSNVPAAWARSPFVANFLPESRTVQLVQARLPDFRVLDFEWTADGRLLLGLSGERRTPKAGQTALCLIDPSTESARLLVVPGAAFPALRGVAGSMTTESGNLVLLRTGSPSGADVLGALRADSGEFRFLPNALALFRMPEGTSGIGEVLFARVHPAGSALLLAARDGRGGARIMELPLATSFEQGTPVADLDQEITTAQYGGGGDSILWTTGSGNSTTVWLYNRQNRTTAMVAQGAVAIPPGAMNPEGSRIITLEHDGSGTRHAYLHDLAGNAEPTDLGPAEAAAWLHAHNRIAVAAPDRKGGLQIWRLSPDAPTEREQLTFFDEGLEPVCRANPRGDQIVSVMRGTFQPTLVLIQPDPPAAF